MFRRLLPSFVCLLSLSLASPAQQPGTTKRPVPETCAVTKPLDHPFVPPRPYRALRSNSGGFLFGTDRFWTLLHSDGIWAQGEKTLWFRQEWGHRTDKADWVSGSKLAVRARRLDGPAPLPEILRATSSYTRDLNAFLLGGINFSTPGCWEVSGHYEDDDLTFVVWVVK
jgi:hypothetical protein